MQEQDHGWRVSRFSPAPRNSARTVPARMSFAFGLSFTLLLAAVGPTALLAANNEVAAGAPARVSSPPPAPGRANAVHASVTTTTASLNTLFFDFGNNLVNHKLIHTAVVVTNTGKSTLSLNPALSGDPSFSIVTSTSCGATQAVGKSCDEVLRYVPAKASSPKAQEAILEMNFGNAAADEPNAVAITGVSAALKPGVVTSTNNPQVALYTMKLPFPGRMKVSFGPTKSYGFKTWGQTTDANNGEIGIFVAGMKASTEYHMAASIELSNGVQATDVDHTFTTGAVPAQLALAVTATTMPGMTPQPGIEITNPLAGLVAYDLDGNVIWTYPVPTPKNDILDGFKLLPNGDIMITMGSSPAAKVATDTVNEIREINLAGDTVREISMVDLNAALSTATCAECSNLNLYTFHHDVTPLPNGHWLVLTNLIRKLSPTTKPPLTTGPPTDVTGDVIVDLDENLQPVWAWNEFNHLDPNRQPYSFPDWTHTNAVVYSPDDGNLIVSMRNQNWVVKVNYKNGSGDGSILWTLGEGGTFKLIGGVDPTDWQYAQHYPSFFSPNTSGVFSLGVMDNGDDRLYPKGSKCTPQGTLPASCLYSTIPVFKIDEVGKTATLTFHQKVAASLYNYFGGNTEELANGDVEYDLCGLIPSGSLVREVTQEKTPKTVWSLQLNAANFYRAFRIPSLYPGVQW